MAQLRSRRSALAILLVLAVLAGITVTSIAAVNITERMAASRQSDPRDATQEFLRHLAPRRQVTLELKDYDPEKPAEWRVIALDGELIRQ